MHFSNTNHLPSVYTPTRPFIGLSHSRLLSPCPNHPRAKDWTTRNSLCAMGPAEIIQTSQSENGFPCPAPYFLWKLQYSCPKFPLCFCLLDSSGVALCGPLPLATITNHVFNDNCLLICRPYYTSRVSTFWNTKVLLLDLSLMLISHEPQLGMGN